MPSSTTVSRQCSHRNRFHGFDQLDPEILKNRLTTVDPLAFQPSSITPQIAWLGHASFLIVWQHTKLLIDPVFKSRIFLSPRRSPVPDLNPQEPPDSILLSHSHMDHMDNSTLARFPNTEIILPQKSENFLNTPNRERTRSMVTGQTLTVGSLQITCVPALHGGWRYPWQKGFFACGYLISDGHFTLYYAGDTAYGNHFNSISKSHSIDTAILPIGAYSPQWFLKSRHMNPSEAIQATLDLNAKTVIPCHFGTYRVSLEKTSDAFPRFAQEAQQRRINCTIPICSSV